MRYLVILTFKVSFSALNYLFALANSTQRVGIVFTKDLPLQYILVHLHRDRHWSFTYMINNNLVVINKLAALLTLVVPVDEAHTLTVIIRVVSVQTVVGTFSSAHCTHVDEFCS